MAKITPITEINKSIDDMNIETMLFLYNDGRFDGRYGVKVTDLDANEVAGLTVYPTLILALDAYAKIVNGPKTIGSAAI